MSDIKSTHLYPLHKECNAKIVNFGGWNMPVSYSGTLKEHEAVRTACGLFDVSHMGEVFIRGENSLAFCQWLLTNDVSKLAIGAGQYTAMLNEQGGFIDDLIIYRTQKDEYFLCINAGNTAKDVAWIESKANEFAKDVVVRNVSKDYSQLALQGPTSKDIIMTVLDDENRSRVADLDYTEIAAVNIRGHKAMVARTGYTGEFGYEIYCSHDLATTLWREWIMSGQHQVTPCGLGARDTLRLESCYPLYGNEMDESVNPYEIGIGWAVKPQAKDFIGKESLSSSKDHPARKLVAFQMIDKSIPRHAMPVLKEGAECGVVTSGSMLPTLGFAGGLALIDARLAKVGDEIQIDVRGKIKLARIIKKPLYSPRVR